MVPEELKKYINDCRQNGLSDELIKQNLLSSGWPEQDVNEALNQSNYSFPPVPPNNPKKEQIGINLDKDFISRAIAFPSYMFLGVIIPIVLSKDDPFVQFHVKQGLVLCILEIVASVFGFFVGYIPVVSIFVSPLLSLLWIFFGVLSVIGVYNVRTGKMKELPIIGGFASRINF
jgi:uncharacterized membrane protein